MRELPGTAKLGAFILVFVGTLGLLLNEFLLHWGRAGTLSFAAATVIGFAILALSLLGPGKADGS